MGDWSGFYYHWVAQGGEEDNCFFIGACCSRTRVALFDSSNTDCLLSKFNFVNNLVTVGNFHPRYGVTTIQRDSFIVLNATSNTISPFIQFMRLSCGSKIQSLPQKHRLEQKATLQQRACLRQIWPKLTFSSNPI